MIQSKEPLKASELRIGNWMYSKVQHPESRVDNAHYCQITSIEDDIDNYCVSCKCGLRGYIQYFDPIPITPEILEKAGFVEDGNFDNHSVDYYRLGPVHIQFPNYEGWSIDYVWRDNVTKEQYSIEIKYLHQLQNLFFSLTNQELTITL